MTNENFSEESPLDKEKREVRALEARVESLKESINNLNELSEKHKSKVAEHEEVSLIINGLFDKVQVLVEENSAKSEKMPESDEEWDALMKRNRRISDIYTMLDNLASDQDNIEQQVVDIQREIDAIEIHE